MQILLLPPVASVRPGPRSPTTASASRLPAPAVPLPSRRGALQGAAWLAAASLLSASRAAAVAEDESALRAAVAAALAKAVPASKAPAVLRLAFHDAGTWRPASRDGGANASILFELDRPESFGLKRGLKPVQEARELLRGTVAQEVSLADLIQLAGAHAVAVTGGPSLRVALGRLDADGADPEGRLPAETLSGPELREHFAAAGYTARELVALSGAHTLGSKGFGAPLAFDNANYRTLLARPWSDPRASADDRAMAAHVGLPSDHAMPEDPELLSWIQKYADDQNLWFEDFSAAYLKMGLLGATWREGIVPPPPETRS